MVEHFEEIKKENVRKFNLRLSIKSQINKVSILLQTQERNYCISDKEETVNDSLWNTDNVKAHQSGFLFILSTSKLKMKISFFFFKKNFTKLPNVKINV